MLENDYRGELSLAVYEAVYLRRLQFDNLLWQVPVLSLTGQAFLFTTALDGGTSRMARLIAASLALVASVLSMHLMARHRQAEVSDARWLEEFERRHFTDGQDTYVVHGRAFKTRRDAQPAGGPLAKIAAFPVWVGWLGLFGLAAVIVLVVTCIEPGVLTEAQPSR